MACAVIRHHFAATLISFSEETQNSGDRRRGTDREETADREAWSQPRCLPDRLSVDLPHVKHLTSAGAALIMGDDDFTVWTTTEDSFQKVCVCAACIYFCRFAYCIYTRACV